MRVCRLNPEANSFIRQWVTCHFHVFTEREYGSVQAMDSRRCKTQHRRSVKQVKITLPSPNIVTHGLPLGGTVDASNQEAKKTASLSIASIRRFCSLAHTGRQNSTRLKHCTVDVAKANTASWQARVNQPRPTS